MQKVYFCQAVPKIWVKEAFIKNDSDNYVLHFKRQDYLFSMIFCCLEKYNSLREFSEGILVYQAKKKLFELIIFPKRAIW